MCSTLGSARASGPSQLWVGPPSNRDYRRYYPTDLLVTGPDILLPWVSRML